MEKQTKSLNDLQVTKPDNWEVRDRTYILRGNKAPLVFTIPTRHTSKAPLLWFDEEKGYQRELRYATNMPSVFVDEQKGEAILGHIIMRNGKISVPAHQQNLQLLLSCYHPYLEKKVYFEKDVVQEAGNHLDWLELEIEALTLARSLSIEHAEAIVRVENGSTVSNMTSKEIKRDLLVFAKSNPILFLELAGDENVELRNFGIKATEAGILKLSQDQRTISWASNGRKVMTVPFDEHPYSALAAFFKTDEGIEIYKNIEKRLK